MNRPHRLPLLVLNKQGLHSYLRERCQAVKIRWENIGNCWNITFLSPAEVGSRAYCSTHVPSHPVIQRVRKILFMNFIQYAKSAWRCRNTGIDCPIWQRNTLIPSFLEIFMHESWLFLKAVIWICCSIHGSIWIIA